MICKLRWIFWEFVCSSLVIFSNRCTSTFSDAVYLFTERISHKLTSWHSANLPPVYGYGITHIWSYWRPDWGLFVVLLFSRERLPQLLSLNQLVQDVMWPHSIRSSSWKTTEGAESMEKNLHPVFETDGQKFLFQPDEIFNKKLIRLLTDRRSSVTFHVSADALRKLIGCDRSLIIAPTYYE